jgi:glycosyltransferase involved in cell wall biosynthesis
MTTASTAPKYSLLLICQTYFPVLGGSEIEAQRVCAELIRRGHQVTVVCAGGGPMPRVSHWVDPQGVPVRIFAMRADGTFKNVIYALRVVWLLIRERNNYQFVYFLMQGLHLALGLPLARILNKPILAKIAGSGEFQRMSQSRVGRLELYWLNRWAKKVLILNEGMRQEAIDHGIFPQKLLLMPNPVDTDVFSPALPEERVRLCERFAVPATVPVIIYCGRLAPEKSLSVLLNSYRIVLEKIPEAILILVGDGPERSALLTQAKQLGFTDQNIRFTGRVDPADVSGWLKISTIFALVSPAEGFPCALEEAMSTGLASVASDIPGNRQLVQDELQSILVPVANIQKTADAMLRLIQDAPLRNRMSLAAREHIVANYSTQNVVDAYEAVFRLALE